MGTIVNAINAAWRDFVTENVPASGAHEPVKSEIRALGGIIESVVATAGSDISRFATVAAMDAAPGAAAGELAYVYNNAGSPSDAANGYYQWSGSAWVAAPWLLVTSVALQGELDHATALLGTHWLDTGAIDGRLSAGAGWTDAKRTLARAIKFARIRNADPGDQYYIGIFQNNTSGADHIYVYRASDSVAVSGLNAVISKSATGLTRVEIPGYSGATEKVTLWIDYRELSSTTGTISNSATPGPLWFARETADTLADARLMAVENKALMLRNQAVNGGCFAGGPAVVIAAPFSGEAVPFKAPVAALAARGIAQSISFGPEATGLAFGYFDHAVDHAAAGQYFFVSHYIYASDDGDFPASINAYSMFGETLGSALNTGAGYEEIDANTRLYWCSGPVPNAPAITAIRFGAGAKLAHAGEIGGFTARVHSSAIGVNDVSRDDWLGYAASETAIASPDDYFADLITPFVASDGALKGITGAAETVTLADNVGTIRTVAQSGPLIRWIDDHFDARREFDLRGMAALAPLGVSKIIFKPMLGQSLSVGTGGHPIVTATTPRPGRAFMFNGGTRVTQGSLFTNDTVRDLQDKQMLRLVPLIEQLAPNGLNFGETQGGGEAWVLGAPGGMAANEVLVFASFGFGGLGIDDLDQGSVPYANMLRGVERLKVLCDLGGYELEVPGVDWAQGEANYSTAGATYTAAMLALQADIEADIQAIIGGSDPIPLIIRQPSSWTANVAGYQMASSAAMLAVIDAALSNPTKLKLAGPQYATGGYYDGIHKGAAAYRREGEYLGRATRQIRAGAGGFGLWATGAANSGTTITITFNATSQIAIDTTLVTDPGQKGLRLIAPDGVTTIALSSIAVSGTDKITAVAASALTAGQTYTVGIADVGTVNTSAGPTTGARCSIRDSSTDGGSSGVNLYNWAHHQRVSFVAT